MERGGSLRRKLARIMVLGEESYTVVITNPILSLVWFDWACCLCSLYLGFGEILFLVVLMLSGQDMYEIVNMFTS